MTRGRGDNPQINLSKKPKEDAGEGEYISRGTKFTVTRHDINSPKGFFKYIHTPDRTPITLNRTLTGNGGTIVALGESSGQPIDNVKEVSVFYWEDAPSNPLLIGIKYGTGTPTYYSRGSDNDWNLTSQLQGELLEAKLDYQNCLLNSAVTINLTNSQTKYCCGGNHGQNITVTSAQLRCATHPSSSHVTVKKHSITGGNYKLAKIKYYDNGNTDLPRKNITATGLEFPMDGPLSVYVFYCNDKNPVLMYIKGEKSAVAGWYQKPSSVGSSGNTYEQWAEVFSVFLNITPEDFSKLECNQWTALITELNRIDGCTGLKTCPLPKPQPPTPVDPSGAEETLSPKPETAQESQAEKSIAGGLATGLGIWSISGISSGTLTGAGGLTGLGWWMFKRSKGDPWVRQVYLIEFLKNVPY